jgi:hypothetical protein
MVSIANEQYGELSRFGGNPRSIQRNVNYSFYLLCLDWSGPRCCSGSMVDIVCSTIRILDVQKASMKLGQEKRIFFLGAQPGAQRSIFVLNLHVHINR